MLKRFLLVLFILVAFAAPIMLIPDEEPLHVVYALEPSTSLNSSDFMFDLRTITHEDIKEENFIQGGINFIFERVVTILAATIGAAAVFMITVGGFMMLASGGRQEWIDKGKSIITKSLFGLAAALLAYILVQAVQLLINSIYA